MSGRGKGNKGLAVFHKEISDEDAFDILITMLSKHNASCALTKRSILLRSCPRWIYEFLFRTADTRKNVREKIASALDIQKNITLKNIDEAKKAYTKAKRLYAIQKNTRIKNRNVIKQIQQQVSYYPRFGHRFLQTKQHFDTMRSYM